VYLQDAVVDYTVKRSAFPCGHVPLTAVWNDILDICSIKRYSDKSTWASWHPGISICSPGCIHSRLHRLVSGFLHGSTTLVLHLLGPLDTSWPRRGDWSQADRESLWSPASSQQSHWV